MGVIEEMQKTEIEIEKLKSRKVTIINEYVSDLITQLIDIAKSNNTTISLFCGGDVALWVKNKKKLSKKDIEILENAERIFTKYDDLFSAILKELSDNSIVELVINNVGDIGAVSLSEYHAMSGKSTPILATSLANSSIFSRIEKKIISNDIQQNDDVARVLNKINANSSDQYASLLERRGVFNMNAFEYIKSSGNQYKNIGLNKEDLLVLIMNSDLKERRPDGGSMFTDIIVGKLAQKFGFNNMDISNILKYCDIEKDLNYFKMASEKGINGFSLENKKDYLISMSELIAALEEQNQISPGIAPIQPVVRKNNKI